ncbi:MAG: hypothetical protein L0Y70_07325, partial [Gemmataceae bacterium]|nr:hypothetical protein [Gemmataceae bacterium]
NSTAQWQLVFFHHPAYTYVTNHGPTIQMRWPFDTWGADGVFSGHNHNMQRMEANGIPYFVSGAAGNSIYAISGEPSDATGKWYNATKYGFMLVDATDKSLIFQFIDKDGTVLDISTVPEPGAAAFLIICATVLFTCSRTVTRIRHATRHSMREFRHKHVRDVHLMAEPAKQQSAA